MFNRWMIGLWISTLILFGCNTEKAHKRGVTWESQGQLPSLGTAYGAPEPWKTVNDYGFPVYSSAVTTKLPASVTNSGNGSHNPRTPGMIGKSYHQMGPQEDLIATLPGLTWTLDFPQWSGFLRPNVRTPSGIADKNDHAYLS